MKNQDYFELEGTMKRVSKSNKPIIDLLLNINGENKSLLDLGCGKGVLSVN